MNTAGPLAVARPERAGAPLARLALLIDVLLMVYASLYPFTGWTDVGVSAFAYLRAPWPPYWVGTEILANVAAYVPAGALFVWAVYPASRGLAAVLLAALFCAGLSGGLEALQTFLPNRISSNVDLAANAAGGLAGALLGAATASRLIGEGALVRWRERWFIPAAGPALILAGLWIFMQIPRQPMLFGTGELSLVLGEWAAVPAGLLGELWSPSPLQRIWAESVCTAAAIVAAAMLLLHVSRPLAVRGILPLALVGSALAAKVLMQPLAVPSLATGAWITAGAVAGIAVGTALALLFSYLKPAWQRGLAISALLVQLIVINLFPSDQYFDMSTSMARTGWLHLESLTLGLSVIWPLAALFLLARRRA